MTRFSWTANSSPLTNIVAVIFSTVFSSLVIAGTPAASFGLRNVWRRRHTFAIIFIFFRVVSHARPNIYALFLPLSTIYACISSLPGCSFCARWAFAPEFFKFILLFTIMHARHSLPKQANLIFVVQEKWVCDDYMFLESQNSSYRLPPPRHTMQVTDNARRRISVFAVMCVQFFFVPRTCALHSNTHGQFIRYDKLASSCQ